MMQTKLDFHLYIIRVYQALERRGRGEKGVRACAPTVRTERGAQRKDSYLTTVTSHFNRLETRENINDTSQITPGYSLLSPTLRIHTLSRPFVKKPRAFV